MTHSTNSACGRPDELIKRRPQRRLEEGRDGGEESACTLNTSLSHLYHCSTLFYKHLVQVMRYWKGSSDKRNAMTKKRNLMAQTSKQKRKKKKR